MLWTIGQFPELDHLEPAQRATLLRKIPWWTYPAMASRALFLGTIISFVLTPILFAILFRGPVPPDFFWTFPIIISCVAPVIYQKELKKIRKDVRQTIARAFEFEQPPFCFGCGYNLRGSNAAACPECGEQIGRPEREMTRP